MSKMCWRHELTVTSLKPKTSSISLFSLPTAMDNSMQQSDAIASDQPLGVGPEPSFGFEVLSVAQWRVRINASEG